MSTMTYEVPSALPPVPTISAIREVIPDHCFERSLPRSLSYAAMSLGLTLGTSWLAITFLPLTWAFLPVWILYAAVCGTFATGVWVVAHECGHGAFTDHKRLQDTIGFVLHSALLVPYYSWQRSHAIHHAKTNHVTDGESHVPHRFGPAFERRVSQMKRPVLGRVSALHSIGSRLTLGWPVYLLIGSTGGPERGTTNHFWPYRPFSKALFPARLNRRVLGSAAGVVAVVALLVGWAIAIRNPFLVLAVYVGPYLVVNAWLVTITLLQHTDAEVPHYDDADWSYVRGAFCSIDRRYGAVCDFLLHRIGTTHVAHHLVSRIPHYHAREATDAIAAAFPDLYRYDPTLLPVALWRVGKECVAVAPTEDGWRFVQAD